MKSIANNEERNSMMCIWCAGDGDPNFNLNILELLYSISSLCVYYL